MNSIKICNLRNNRIRHPWQVRVDRASVLGNPYFMFDESERDWCCDLYRDYLVQQIRNRNEIFLNELQRLLDIWYKYGKLELFCWCAPKRCHAETIKGYLEWCVQETIQ